MPSGDRQLGHIMVLYPGHPLVGHVVSVVRRYGQRERGQWVVELSDGSRQYVPISWCSPLSLSEETLAVPASAPDGPPSDGATPSPLSLSALRDLAAVVRRLQEEGAQRGEEQQDAGPGAGEESGPGRGRGSGKEIGVTGVGELPGSRSTAAGAHDPANSTAPGRGAGDEQPPENVRES